MKNLATILCVGIIGFAQAQSTSTDVEIYERYENGELVEQRQSATENGVPIENYDFDKAKRDMQLKSAEIENKMEQMQRDMNAKMNDFEQRSQEMQQRMSDFQRKSDEMQQRIDQKMNEMDSKSNQIKDSEKKYTPAPSEKSGVGKSTKDTKFT